MGTSTGIRNFQFFLVVSEKFGTGKKSRKNLVPEKKSRNWYLKNLVPEKVSDPVSEFFDTGIDFCRQNLGILKIYNGYWYRYRDFFIFSGGIGKVWYRKQVSEPVSVKFGIEKKSRNRYRKNLVPEKKYRYRYRYQKYLVPEKKVSVSVLFNILGTVTTVL